MSCPFHTPRYGYKGCPYRSQGMCPFSKVHHSPNANVSLNDLSKDIKRLYPGDIRKFGESIGLVTEVMCVNGVCKEIAYAVALEDGNGSVSKKLKRAIKSKKSSRKRSRKRTRKSRKTRKRNKKKSGRRKTGGRVDLKKFGRQLSRKFSPTSSKSIDINHYLNQILAGEGSLYILNERNVPAVDRLINNWTKLHELLRNTLNSNPQHAFKAIQNFRSNNLQKIKKFDEKFTILQLSTNFENPQSQRVFDMLQKFFMTCQAYSRTLTPRINLQVLCKSPYTLNNYLKIWEAMLI